MGDVAKVIGLSLGADICWPICYEEILKRLKLSIPSGDDRLSFKAERLTIEPYDLRQSCKYSVVLDRLTHWYHTSREWIKKSVILNDLYVLNNPWTVQSMEKQTTYCAMIRLGLPIPNTWMVPPKDYDVTADLKPTLHRYARLFDLGEVGKRLRYPLFMKPYDGGGWMGVSRVKDDRGLREAYEKSGKLLMHLQEAVDPYDAFVRCVGLGPQVHMVDYAPDAPLHRRYTPGPADLSQADRDRLRKITLTINSFFGWDFNSCESLRQRGEWIPIDFANPCPDSQVTSLGWHFPWLIKANIRWSVFAAATGRKVRRNQDWEPFFEIAAQDGLSYDEKLDRYAALAERHFETDRFHEFCDEHLAHLDEVTWRFFGEDMARDAVRQKVESLFPSHEIDEFTDYFWGLIQDWRGRDETRQPNADLLVS